MEVPPVKANCTQLKLNERFQSVDFWGKIFGLRHDYIILQARSLDRFEIITKWFFSEDEGLTFAELPPVERWMTEKCSTVFTHFEGSSAYIYKEKPKDGEEPEEPENAEEAGEEEERLTELQRLAVVVKEISNECVIAPANSLRLTSNKHFIKEPAYKGMGFEESRDLASYVHLRQPDIKKIYNADTFTEITSILDPIIEDPAPIVWSLKTRGDGFVSLRNMKWPGFEFQASAHSDTFAQGYFGNGVPRTELNWMVTQPE
jgi:hypothetical protein